MKESTISKIWAIVATIVSISLAVCGIWNSMPLFFLPTTLIVTWQLWSDYKKEKKLEDDTIKI